MPETTVEITKVERLNRQVRRITTTKPEGFDYHPGQGADVALASGDAVEGATYLAFTSVPADPHLQFLLKTGRPGDALAEVIDRLDEGDRLRLDGPKGSLTYRGPGVFIAGGAGVAPFVSILRSLQHERRQEPNWLFFSNPTRGDTFMQDELSSLVNGNVIYTVTEEEPATSFEHGRIDRNLINRYVSLDGQYVYISGPEDMVFEMASLVSDLGVDDAQIVYEEFRR